MTTIQQRRARERIKAEGFNADYSVGTPVLFRHVLGDDSKISRTKTRSEAFVAASGDAVVFLEGISGFVALSHCEVIDPVGDEPIL